jgi:hypothetical protein
LRTGAAFGAVVAFRLAVVVLPFGLGDASLMRS